jgi:small multidrug resistance pump
METKALLFLAAAIAAELLATSSLKASQGFTRLTPSIVVVIGYGVAFYCLGMSLKTIPIGVVYAIWSGVGTAVIALVGWLIYHERLTPGQLAGIGLIVAGTVLLHLTTAAPERPG